MTTPGTQCDDLLPAALVIARRLVHRIAPLRESAAHRKAFQLAERVTHFGPASDVSLSDIHSARVDVLRATRASSGAREYHLAQSVTSELLNVVERDLQISALRIVAPQIHAEAQLVVREGENSLATLRELAREVEDWHPDLTYAVSHDVEL